VDRLQGLKERQDAAITESERLQKTVKQNGKWKRPMLDSLVADRQAQLDLAKETTLLCDKLKGAKVYHMVLDRAAKAMETSANKIEAHRQFAVPLQEPAVLDKEQMDQNTGLVKETVKHQKEASDRLQHLIEALLPELERPVQDGKNGNGDGDGSKKPKGGLKAQDGIPAVAQLKVLKAEQEAVYDRTLELANQFNRRRSTPAQRLEISAIHAEQERLLDLFREMVTSANEEGKQP
jgi:hypothetical protein